MIRPAFQFYPGDWLRDAALRSVSVEARGLWIDMICLMHQGTPYGHLRFGQKIIDADNLGRMVGLDGRLTTRLIDELTQAGVCCPGTDGVIFSKRMIQDEELRLKRISGGHLGGNPALKKRPTKVNHKDNHQGYPDAEDEDEDYSSQCLKGRGVGKGGTEALEIYEAYPRKVGRKSALKAIAISLRTDAPDELLAKTRAYAAATKSWPDDQRQFIPHPATWFNRGSYDDDPATWVRLRPTNGVSQSVQMIADQKELDRIADRIKTIKDQASQTAMGSSYTDDQKAELSKLSERRKELRKRTGAMI